MLYSTSAYGQTRAGHRRSVAKKVSVETPSAEMSGTFAVADGTVVFAMVL